ncbi:hypothetical protein [Neobacillus sp. YIM B06451]|uniref:hypothetical protein n=1 Tax=Neobacillus sp. YIM B06451 TaxID=3070994 RepID=UPI002931A874|nr:hypothetical protein [Neobacillus sp. YIM B06451]
MKLIIFFGLIAISLSSSLLLSRNELKNKKPPLTAAFKAIIINITILGTGSIWWFLTETDGISQGIGVMIYAGSAIAIALITIVFTYFFWHRSG